MKQFVQNFGRQKLAPKKKQLAPIEIGAPEKKGQDQLQKNKNKFYTKTKKILNTKTKKKFYT